jgi:arylsulfatase A-like enzyme
MNEEIRRLNVILITIDSLRAGHVSCLGYSKNTTPNMDRIAKEGCLFSQAIANAPSTAYSFRAILCSLYPLMYMDGFRLPKQVTTIAEILKNKGYETFAFHSNPYLSRYYDWDRGFDVFDDCLTSEGPTGKMKNKVTGFLRHNERVRQIYALLLMINKKGRPSLRRADEINKKGLSQFQQQSNKNFFLWLHYMDTHTPYTLPRKRFSNCGITTLWKYMKIFQKLPHSEEIPEDDLQKVIEMYDEAIECADHALGPFFEKLKKMGIYHNTFVIITADHGEEFREHSEGVIGHPPMLYDELLHVPLIIKGPGIPEDVVIEEQVSLLDIAPTIIDLLNLPRVKQFHGKSLVPLIKGRESKIESFVISECFHSSGKGVEGKGKGRFSIRSGREKLMYDVEDDHYEFYDLKNDPLETRDLYEGRKGDEVLKQLKSKLEAHIIMERREMSKVEKERIKRKVGELKNLRIM